MRTILIAGGTGVIGSRLSALLIQNGYKVAILTRNPRLSNHFFWSPKEKIVDEKALEGVEILINLSGEGIAEKRWTSERKKELHDSRIGTNAFLFSLSDKMPLLQQFISSSGINCYGYEDSNALYSEESPFGTDYLSQLVREWEESADLFHTKCKVVKVRTAVVFDALAGALQKMLPPIQLGVGSPLGSGNQYMPWIHISDLTKLFMHCIEKELDGAYNAVADNDTNETVMYTIAQVLNKPFWFPNVPAFVLQLLFGEMASMLLNGVKASNAKLKATNFKFKFDELDLALENALKK